MEGSSRMEGSVGGVGDRTHLFEEYFVRIKFSILESEGICDDGNEASQYLPVSLRPKIPNEQASPTASGKRVLRGGRVTCWLFCCPI